MSSLDAKRRRRRPEGAEGTVCEAGGPRHQNGAEFEEKPVFDRWDTPRRTPTQSNTSVKDLGKTLAPSRRGTMRPCNRPHEVWKPPLLAPARPAGTAGHRVELLVVDGHGDQQRSPRPRLGSARRQARPARSHRPLVRSRQPLRGLSSLDEGPAHKRRLHRLRRICNRIEANPVRAAHARAAPSEETHELAGVAACSDWLSTCRAYGAGVAPSGSTTAFCCSGQTIGKGGGVVDVQSCQRNS